MATFAPPRERKTVWAAAPVPRLGQPCSPRRWPLGQVEPSGSQGRGTDFRGRRRLPQRWSGAGERGGVARGSGRGSGESFSCARIVRAEGGPAEILPWREEQEEEEGDDQSLSDPASAYRVRWAWGCPRLQPGSEKAPVSLRLCSADLGLRGPERRDFPGLALEMPCSAEKGMNCRSEVLEVSVEGRQVEEAMLAVLHTVLLHRSTGKFHYKKEGTYSIGTVGTQDVDCDFIDFTYVRVSSEELDRALRKVVGEFKDALRNSGGDGLGQMSLEFYQKKKSRWPFSDECIPWEVWTVKVHVVALATEQERQICREKVGEKLCEKIINIVEVMNRHEYLPKMPTQSEVDNVFDTGLRDVQPYLYKISFQITDALGTSVTTTMRRLIKDTLAL